MSFENNIKKMFTELDEGQKDWFRFDLPKHLQEWVGGGFNGKQLSTNPNLIENYLKREVSLSYVHKVGVLDDLLIALWCIRKCYGPIRSQTLYRLTKIKSKVEVGQRVKIEITDLLKPITSWTTRENVEVHDRKPSDSDYILVAHNVPSKHILTSMDIVHLFAYIVRANASFFGLNSKRKHVKQNKKTVIGEYRKHSTNALMEWHDVFDQVGSYLFEKEYVLYLHPNEHIYANVHKHVKSPAKKIEVSTEQREEAMKKLQAAVRLKPTPSPAVSNPFSDMKSVSPKKQIEMLEYHIEKERAKGLRMDAARLQEMKRQLEEKRTYVEQNKIDLK